VSELCCVAEMQRRLFPREEDEDDGEDEGKLPRKPTTTTTTTAGLFLGFEVLCRSGSRSRRRRRRGGPRAWGEGDL